MDYLKLDVYSKVNLRPFRKEELITLVEANQAIQTYYSGINDKQIRQDIVSLHKNRWITCNNDLNKMNRDALVIAGKAGHLCIRDYLNKPILIKQKLAQKKKKQSANNASPKKSIIQTRKTSKTNNSDSGSEHSIDPPNKKQNKDDEKDDNIDTSPPNNNNSDIEIPSDYSS